MEYLGSKLVLGRPGHPDEIASAVLFTAGPEPGFIAGQTTLVDGGQIGRPNERLR